MNEVAPVQTAYEAPACARAPVGMLCELTHRCPLQCPYCSNPLELERVNTEMTTAEWQSVMRQAASLGVLQIHLSGGEPTTRKDLEAIVQVATEVGLYTNLITAGVTLTKERLKKLADLGLDHVQLSIQDVDPENADRIAAYKGGMAKKIEVAAWVKEFDLPLTINAPIHRQNIHNVSRIIDFAVEVGAGRLEIAHIQYYAWALKNRSALMPTREDFMKSYEIVEASRASSLSTSWCPTTTPNSPSPAWAAGDAASSTSRLRARSCRAMPRSRCRDWSSTTLRPSRWPTSGWLVRPSRSTGAQTG
jgi:PqqA peptide cyclase